MGLVFYGTHLSAIADEGLARAAVITHFLISFLREPDVHSLQLETNNTIIVTIIIYPLTTRVVQAPQMISQPVSSIFPCSLLPSGTWRTPGLSIP